MKLRYSRVNKMLVAEVFDINKNKVSEIELNDAVFGAEVNDAVIYDVVRMQMASRRFGTAATKGRSDVSGGGKKPWRQKGTGRARSGTSRSPIWRGGGIVFGPVPRDYKYNVPKKVRKNALRSVLSLKYQGQKLVVLKDFPLDEIKTKKFKEVVDRFGLKKALFVTEERNEFLEKSSRNIAGIKMVRSEGLNVYDVLNHEHLVIIEPAVKKLEGALKS
ncbi:LSU ribosomal protein L4 [Syntrophus aciditrophicus SB]|uniref:Large ribosomal subunit protein uL4 n=2 Tax=Syntrophus TaxID=43773 RepID=RL4_SYNAS|nr:RecName: Full=Large ribosomal subunit protein uL4; AltName: Full=50S ribosomal protein L4 [Syntrophus aciditrophicus SB]ABC76181.1 LSU ribosomal protein L4 [Syntrophus aciditrophicus SB]